MKYANLIHATGAIIVITYAIMKIAHIGHEYINVNILLTLGFLVAYIAQSMKVRLLEKKFNDNKTTTLS